MNYQLKSAKDTIEISYTEDQVFKFTEIPVDLVSNIVFTTELGASNLFNAVKSGAIVVIMDNKECKYSASCKIVGQAFDALEKRSVPNNYLLFTDIQEYFNA